MMQLEDWFESWVPESVFSAGGRLRSHSLWRLVLMFICLLLMWLLSPLTLLTEGSWIGFSLVLDCLPGFQHACFAYHAHVPLRFAARLGESWTRDGGIPQGCPLSVMVLVALNHLGVGICRSGKGNAPNMG